MAKEKEQSGVTGALVAGAVAGVAGLAAGVLLAPKKGEETRADLAKTAENLQTKGKEVADKVGEKVAEVRGRFEDEKQRLQTEFESQMSEFKTQIDKLDDKKVAKDLATLRDEAQAKFEELRSAGEDKYQDIRADVEAKVADLKAKLEKVA